MITMVATTVTRINIIMATVMERGDYDHNSVNGTSNEDKYMRRGGRKK